MKAAPADEITFSEVFDTVFADWFDGDTWRVWRVVGKALFGEPLTPEELETFTRFTGRTVGPDSPAREIWLAVGRRGGKDWFAAAVVVYLACFRRHDLKTGELGRVMLLAVDQDQASECFRYITELIDSVPELAAMVVKKSTKLGFLRLDLSNRIQILVKPADKRRVRGRTVLAIVADEIAFWWSDETSANPDREVLKALKPSMLGVKGALLIAISSPYARRGLLWEKYKDHFGVNSDRVLFWKAATWEMRPSTDEDFLAFLEEEKKADPVSYASEYGAEFRQDLESYTSIEQIEAVTIKGRVVMPYESGVRHVAFIDTAGGAGQDSVVLCIARFQHGLAIVCRVVEWRPPFSATAVAKEAAAVLREYGLSQVTGDNFSGATWADLIRQQKITYNVSDKTKSDIFHDFLPLLNGKLVELLDPESSPTAQRAVNQFLALERTVSRNGKDTIGHPRGGTDDIANAIAGALLLCRQPATGFVGVVVHRKEPATPEMLREVLRGPRRPVEQPMYDPRYGETPRGWFGRPEMSERKRKAWAGE